jgi:hypothetical protein
MLPVIGPGWAGAPVTVTLRTALIPHPFILYTVTVPEVNVEAQFTVMFNPVLDPMIVPLVTVQKYDIAPGTADIVYTAPLVPHIPVTGPEINPGRVGRFKVTAFVLTGLVPQILDADTDTVPPMNAFVTATWIIFVPAPEMMFIPAGTVQL